MPSNNTGPPERPARPVEISFGKAAVRRVRAGFIDGDDRLHGLWQRRRQSEPWAARLPGGRSQRHEIAVFTKNPDGCYVSADPIGPNGCSAYMLAMPRPVAAVRIRHHSRTPLSCSSLFLPAPSPSRPSAAIAKSARILKDRPEAAFLFERGFSREWTTSFHKRPPVFHLLFASRTGLPVHYLCNSLATVAPDKMFKILQSRWHCRTLSAVRRRRRERPRISIFK